MAKEGECGMYYVYSYISFMTLNGIIWITKGTIKDDVECPTFCTQQYQPVCGSDGKTYGNACELKAVTCKDSSIKQVKQGECTAGMTKFIFINSSFYPHYKKWNVQLTVASDVEGKLLCGRKCEEENDPICGSDGITYASSCILSWESCNKGLSVEPLHKGACGKKQNEIRSKIKCSYKYY